MQHLSAHPGEIFVDEAPIRPYERTGSGFQRSVSFRRGHCMTRKDFLKQGLRNSVRRSNVCCGSAMQSCRAKSQQAAAAQNGGSERIARAEQLLDVDRLFPPDAIDESEIRGGEQAEIVGILAIDALEAPRDDQPD